MKNLLTTKGWLLISSFLCFVQLTAGQTGNDVITAWTGTVDSVNATITGLPANGRVIQLSSVLTVSDSASFRVMDSMGQTAAPQAMLSNGLSVEVTAKNGAVKVYTIEAGAAPMAVDSISNAVATVGSIGNRLLLVGGKTTYHITGSGDPLAGSFLQLGSADVWLYFDNIKPSVFKSRCLDHISVNGQPPVVDSNLRLVQYLQGCVVISQPADYQPLRIFSAESQGGLSMDLGLYTYYRAPLLGSFNDAIASFVLKKGYMATFSENENGTGNSKVYIAADQDLQVNQLPAALKGKISFVRVFPWRWVAKKGWTNTVQMADTLGAKWTYNWNNDRNSTLDAEYVPIRQTQWWPAFSTTNAKTNVTHLLGFNEPDNASQSNLTPDQAIAAWPGLMESGLRLGSPAITDGGANWLYSFMDKADSAGYRVDFVAVHFYRGCQTAAQFYSFLKAIHDRTGRPVWITEFNNGANWTNTSGCPQPSYAQEATAVQSFLNMLDTTSFVERYSLYEWVQDTRQMFNSTSPIVLNPAGVIYRDKVNPMAYNAAQQFDPYPPVTQSPFTSGNLALARFGAGVSQSGANPIFIDEYTVGGGLSQTIALPTMKHGRNLPIVSSSTPTGNSDGLLTLSADGRYISLLGYNTTVGSGSTNGVAATTTPRDVAILDTNGVVNTASSFNDVVSGHVVRGAVVNNNGIYMAGGSANGIRYAPFGSGITTSSTVISAVPGGTRKAAIYGGDIYFTQYTAGLSKLYKIAGTPATATAATALPGIPAATASTVATGFVLFDVNPAVAGYDLLYYTDESPAPAIQKYIFDGTTWISKGSYAITGLNDNVVRDLAGTLVNGIPVLYGVSFTSLAKFEDKAGYGDNSNITQTTLVNKTASSSQAFRGVSFVPGTPVVSSLDFVPPVISCPPADSVNSARSTLPDATGKATATDDRGSCTVTYSDSSTQSADSTQDGFYNYTITRTWTATDPAGNQSTCPQTIFVYTPPQVQAKDSIVPLDDNGRATITPDMINNGSVSHNGALQLALDRQDFTCADAGAPITVTLTGTDARGYVSTAVARVTIVDQQKPRLILPSAQFFCYAGASYQLPVLAASDNCGIAGISWSVGGATARSGTGADASGPFNAGQSTVLWTVTDVHGNTDTGTTTVTVNQPLGAGIPDVYALPGLTAVKNTLFTGYGPCSLTLTATAGGGTAPYSYAWSTGSAASSISVSTANNYSLTLTDAAGCQATASIAIDNRDVRCGNREDKVMVCHNNQLICIAAPAVQAHLRHGDGLGACDGATTAARSAAAGGKAGLISGATVYPNPVSDYVTIQLRHLEAGAVLELYDARGIQVRRQRIEDTTETVPVKELAPGMYWLHIKNGHDSITEKIIKL